MSRKIKCRVYSKRSKVYIDYYTIGFSKSGELQYISDKHGAGPVFAEDYIVEQYTGLKDKNGDKEIYEYDITDGEGNIIGNYHETPELLKDKTNLLIQGFGTKTWLTTYQEAVERGCHDA